MNLTKILILIILSGLAIITKAQDASVEKSIWGVQMGFSDNFYMGIMAYNEFSIADNIILHSEFGLARRPFGKPYAIRKYFTDSKRLQTLAFLVEPRWYFNYKKRLSKGKNVKGNSASFLSLRMSYYPNWIIFPSYNFEDYSNELTIVPTIGYRRTIRNRVNFEIGTGVGLWYENGYRRADGSEESFHLGQLIVSIQLRVGYVFKPYK